MIQYCLPILASSLDEVSERISAQADTTQFFEIWLDYLAQADAQALCALAQRWPGRLIFLLRRQQLEAIHMPIAARIALLEELAPLDAMIDLDVATQQDELAALTKITPRPRLLLSYHNYQSTPPDAELALILARMKTYQPAISKVATFCQTPEDALRLLRLTLSLKEQSTPCIVLGMGPYGTLTRIFGTLWGNAMIFAPPDTARASAPGQLTRPELDTIFAILKPTMLDASKA